MPPATALLYHRLTSLEPGREDDSDPFVRGWVTPGDHPLLVHGFAPNAIDDWPAACKAYPEGLPAVALPRDWPPRAAPATAVLAGRHAAPRAPLDLPALARVLHLSAGGRARARARGPAAAPVQDRGLGGRALSVRAVRGGEARERPGGRRLLVRPRRPCAARHRAGGGRRGDRARADRRAVALGLALRGAQPAPPVLGRGHDAGADPRADGVGRPRTAAVDEVPRCRPHAAGRGRWRARAPARAPRLEDGAPATRPRGAAATGAVDAAPVEFPLITHAQRAGDGDTLGDPWPQAAPLGGEPPGSDDLDAVILRRGSTRIMDARATVRRDVFEFALAAAARGSDVAHFAAAQAVEGMEPGLYRWPRLETPVRRGPLRDELFWACLEQDLGRDAAFVVIAATDLEERDERGYREAQLDAGLGNGRLHLAAFALGIGASGMTFYDSEIAPLLGEPLHGLLFTCVGVPAYRNRRGGWPGAPAHVIVPQRR